MWLERCWGQAVSSVAELEVGEGGGGKKLGGVGPDRPGSRVTGLGSVA